ncbi:MAG: RNA polymerase sigma factor [Myxococcales bacterium]|nr:RNA polymerase sigma factor [Myxococcales bacterium]
MLSDEELLARWMSGDKTAGAQVVDRLYPRVEAYFRSRLRAEDVKEGVQETFARLMAKPENFSGKSRLIAYLLGIARYVFIDIVRGRYALQLDPLTHSVEAIHQIGQSGMASRVDLQECLRALSLRDQDLLELFYWQGLSHREIGELMDMNVNTVKAHLFNARERLRKMMVEHGALSAEDDTLEAHLLKAASF